MKKILLVFLILFFLGFIGYFYFSSKGTIPKNFVGTDGKTSKVGDILSNSTNLKCVYKNEEGVETVTYIKGGVVRVMMTDVKNNEQPNNIVVKKEIMYMWNDSTKTGFSYKIEEPKDTVPLPTVKDRSGNKETGENQKKSILAQIEKYKDACKVEVVADSMFAVPTDVRFQDMSALQEQIMKGLPPASQGSGQEDVQKYIQEMIQQQGQ